MRLGLVVHGIVQGVGFRPFVQRAATARGLGGFVQNRRDGVRVELEGDRAAVESFLGALEHELPPPACIVALERETLAERQTPDFRILESDGEASATPLLPPDLATCAACWAELRTAGARRERYPFTNCAQCGPRLSITHDLPYDRRNTSMRAFACCEACRAEYEDPRDRRFHAEPIACPACGPALSYVAPDGEPLASGPEALEHAARELERGGIVALKGIGGFQLLVDATSSPAVARLRGRKRRPHKPFAVLFRDVTELARHAHVDAAAERELLSPEAPIVLLERAAASTLAPEVSMESHEVGALLPYAPLHGLIAERLARPLVCTSGNLAEEPMATTLEAALERLGGVADGFLTHDRPIVRPVDDSVVRADPRGRSVLRRARGLAPLPVARCDPALSLLALGAHQKSTLTLAHAGYLLVSQHLGDLDSPSACDLLRATAADLVRFFDARLERLACDLHPGYTSSLVAEELAARLSLPLIRVQHHHAHAAAVLAEHALEGPLLALTWDGTGLGADGALWGSEALLIDGAGFRRFAHLSGFPLIGGDRAAREPLRAALGALFAHAPARLEHELSAAFGAGLAPLAKALARRVNSVETTSLGRWFDAVAALLGLGARATYEGQTAMALERLATSRSETNPELVLPLPLVPQDDGTLVGDMAPLLDELLRARDRGVAANTLARAFHDAVLDFGVRVASAAGLERVVLAGGCFQNRILAGELRERLERRGFNVFVPRALPVNDGAISLGQAWIAARA